MKRRLALVALLAAAAFGDDAPKGEDVRFPTADGLSIAATWWPPAAGTPEPAPVVIALPMYKHNRGTYEPMVRPVTDRGMGFLALDLRGHGESARQGDQDLSKLVGDRDPALFNAMHQDVAGALAWLAKEKKTPAGKVALLGASVGCSVAIDVAVRSPEAIAAVACLTPGANYLGVPTLEHVQKWRKGKPLLLVSSEAEAKQGASPLIGRLESKGAELRIVEAAETEAEAGPVDIHGTNMFGHVPSVEANVADWLAFHVAFRRVDLGGGVTAILGSTGDSLYVGVEAQEGVNAGLNAFAVRVGTGDAGAPWSKVETFELAKRLERVPEAQRRRTRVRRESLGVAPGKPFAVAVSLDGKNFLPKDDEAPLFFALR